MRVSSRTGRLKLSPPGINSVHKLESIAALSHASRTTTLHFRSWTKASFNNVGVALGFLLPGGAPKPRVAVEVQDNVMYRVRLDNTFDIGAIRRHFSLGPQTGVSLLKSSGE